MKKGTWKLIIGVIFLLSGISQGPNGLLPGLIVAALCFLWWYFPAKRSGQLTQKSDQRTENPAPKTEEQPAAKFSPVAPQRIEPEVARYAYNTERYDYEKKDLEHNLYFYRDKLNSKKGLSTFDTYIVLDCETTGLSARTDEIIEIAMIKFIKGKEVDRFHSLVKPSLSLPKIITQLTGLTDDDLKDAPLIEDITPQIWSFIQGYYLVGFNVTFDIGFIKKSFAHLGYEGEFNFVDVLQLARKAFPDMPNHKLATLIKAFNLADEQAHRAIDDVIYTQKILSLCLDVLLAQKEKELAVRREARRMEQHETT